jgi:hypothetical protein
MTKYRLLARSELHGAIREPGFIFELAEGEKGPHRTVVASDHGAQITDHLNTTETLTDVPLYEEVVDDPATPHDESKGELSREELEAALAEAQGRIGALDVELADKDRQLGEAHTRLENAQRALAGLAMADAAAAAAG